jgi:hypothetical protein
MATDFNRTNSNPHINVNPHAALAVERKAQSFCRALDRFASEMSERDESMSKLDALRDLRRMLVVENQPAIWAGIGLMRDLQAGKPTLPAGEYPGLFRSSRARIFELIEKTIEAEKVLDAVLKPADPFAGLGEGQQ